ncbi:hypothetical protein C8R47DRAFT_260161 [Mycena vitilis]|nr:hypothetical protein C8R47DRAFT_260161 [Mycena vitilis]
MTTEPSPTKILLVGTQLQVFHSYSPSTKPVATYDMSKFRGLLPAFDSTSAESTEQGNLHVKFTGDHDNVDAYKAAKYEIASGSIQFHISDSSQLMARIIGKRGQIHFEICMTGTEAEPQAFYVCHGSATSCYIWAVEGDRLRNSRPMRISWATEDGEICGKDLRKTIKDKMWERFCRKFPAKHQLQIDRTKWVNEMYQLLFLGFYACVLLEQ